MKGGQYITLLTLFLIGLTMIPHVLAAEGWEGHQKTGPFIDRIEFSFIETDDDRLDALLNGDVDVIEPVVWTSFVNRPELASTNLTFTRSLQNGYGFFSINCNLYPLNLSRFRRAFAYALDKDLICRDIWNGSARPLDAVIPRQSIYSIEGDFPFGYRTSHTTIGNALLDEAGFFDVDIDGWREAPDRSPFVPIVAVAYGSEIAKKCGMNAVEALRSIGIEAYLEYFDTWFMHYSQQYGFLREFDIFFWGMNQEGLDVDWMGDYFWSESSLDMFSDTNPAQFNNSAFDNLRSELLDSRTFEESLSISYEMQRILAYECPIIPLYQNYRLSGYSPDGLEGFVNCSLGGISSFWSGLKVHVPPGTESYPFHGGLNWTLSMRPDLVNFATSATSTSLLYDLLYEPLFRIGPQGEDVQWLVESWQVNPGDGPVSTTWSFDLIKNATWSDGTPLTADDVVFTLNMLIQQGLLSGMDAVYNPTKYTVEVEANYGNFWTFHDFSHIRILPKHLWLNNQTGELRASVNASQLITSGPYQFSELLPDNRIVLEVNPRYHYRADRSWRPPDPVISLMVFAGIPLTIVFTGVIVAEVLMKRTKQIQE